MMKFLVLALSVLSFSAYASNIRVYYPATGQESDLETLLVNTPSNGHVILGEFHYDDKIQQAEALIINEMARIHHKKNDITLGWEFLDHTDSQKIQELSSQVFQGMITPKDFLQNFFKPDDQKYLPLIETIQKSGVKLIGLNVPRAYKQKLIKEGIESLPAGIVPPNMSVGDDFYLERFKAEMGAHVPAEKIGRYFEAQCLTDSAMSYVISKSKSDLNFIVAGSFHTDYFMGTVSRLKELVSGPVTVVKIVNKENLEVEDLNEMKKIHPQFGAISDAIVIIE